MGRAWQDLKRESIQQAVIRLMCREGLKSVTMERVAQEVGIAKGTVYLHYRDKQDLLDAVKDGALTPMLHEMEQILHGDLAPDRKLREYSLRYLAYFEERRDVFRILLYEREVTRVWGSRYQSDRYRRLAEAVSKVIREGIRTELFRDVDVPAAAALFVESNMAMMNQRMLNTHPNPVEEDAELVSSIFIRGLGARTSRPQSAAVPAGDRSRARR
ncbi:MAG TPA: TetR/AcrR family transcriptional regulator [Thermoanaerobaculia bacterium]|nr:TetR/AcrR family transcriptional regulator [Thermoanaerobaculia bacterium]